MISIVQRVLLCAASLLQRYLCQWDNCNSNNHNDRQSLRVPFGCENAGCKFISDICTEHEISSDTNGGFQRESVDISIVYCFGVLVGVAHISVNVGEDAVTAPGSYAVSVKYH